MTGSGTSKRILRSATVTLLGVAVLCCLHTPAFADDPFDFETTKWMSFDRYKDKTKKTGNVPVDAIADDAQKDKKDSPSDAASTPHDLNGAAAAPITPPSMAPQLAQPMRPINIPVMPGANKTFEMRIDSTENDKAPVAQITNIESEPTVTLPEHNWQAPKEAIKHASEEAADDDENQPLDVRMSFLPNRKIAPVPSPEYVSNHGRAPNAIALANKAKEPEQPKASPAACAAVDAYKKHQLAAIQSDRQTLADLQKAIADLGLQKELGYLSDKGTTNNASNSGTVQVDTPPDLANTAKN